MQRGVNRSRGNTEIQAEDIIGSADYILVLIAYLQKQNPLKRPALVYPSVLEV